MQQHFRRGLRSVYERERGTLRTLVSSLLNLVSSKQEASSSGRADKKSTPISFTRL